MQDRPLPAEISRFHTYARRVRRLKITDKNLTKTARNARLFLSSLAGTSPLLPRLRRLHLDVHIPTASTEAFLFLSPFISDLSINFIRSNQSYGYHLDDEAGLKYRATSCSVLEIALAKVPHLSALVLEGFHADTLATYPDSQILGRLHSLIILSPIGTDALSAVSAACHSLETLDVSVVFDGKVDTFPVGFRALKNLRLTGKSPDVSQFLHLVPLPSLEQLTIAYQLTAFQDLIEESAVADMVTTVALHTLRHVHLSVTSNSLINDMVVLLSAVTAPFAAFKLTSFQLSMQLLRGRATLRVTDTDVRAAAAAWPGMKTFGINITCPTSVGRLDIARRRQQAHLRGAL